MEGGNLLFGDEGTADIQGRILHSSQPTCEINSGTQGKLPGNRGGGRIQFSTMTSMVPISRGSEGVEPSTHVRRTLTFAIRHRKNLRFMHRI